MSNEPLGIVAERQAIAAKYARFIARPVRHITTPKEEALPPPAPPRPAPLSPAPIPEPIAIPIPPKLTVSTKGGVYGRDWGGGGKPVPNIDQVSGKARDIIQTVCAVWGVDVGLVLSVRRHTKYARSRQAAMSLMVKFLGLSQHSIGRIFGRDPSTVAHAATHKVPELLTTDRSFRVRHAYATRKLRRMWAIS